jgi:eukaryotic-like serine/threonine-protein kinase
MPGESLGQAGSLSSASEELVDAHCDHFEAAWRRGEGPRIGDYVKSFPAPQRAALFRELLALEIELRGAAGASPKRTDYLARFPEWREIVDAVFSGLHTLTRRSARAPSRLACGDHTVGTPTSQGTRFRIVQLHAKGGLGEVFVARDEELNRQVALKQIQPQFADDSESRERFLREAEITGALEHPGIVPIYGLGRYADGRPFYAMRLIRGQSLRDAIKSYHRGTDERGQKSRSQRALKALLERFLAACNAVAYAHSRGVLHRDLKPANVMLGPFGETLVVDWGLARLIKRSGASMSSDEATVRPSSEIRTISGTALGTVQYMSPEQAAGKLDELGPESDVYGLGATLYTLLVGRAPFPSPRNVPGGNLEVLDQVQRGDFPRPSDVKRDVPAALAAICLKAMALRPGARYPSPLALADDIKRWLSDEPVSAYRAPRSKRVLRWAVRHRGKSAVLAGLVLLAAAMTLPALYLEIRKRSAARDTTEKLERAALADARLAAAELRAGHFAESAAILRQAALSLDREPSLIHQRSLLEARRDSIQHLGEFHRLSDQAERLAMRGEDVDAQEASEAALSVVSVFQNREWWKHLPVSELDAHQADLVKNGVFRQLILLGMTRLESAVSRLGSSAQQKSYESALACAEAAMAFRPDDDLARWIAIFSREGLGHTEAVPSVAAAETTTAAGYDLLGTIHLRIAQIPSGPSNPSWMDRARRVSALDLKAPLARAERCLRAATTLEPGGYWSNVRLGRALSMSGKLDAAEFVFGTCVVLRPEEGLSYAHRGSVILRQRDSTPSGEPRFRLIQRGISDLETALRLSPKDSAVQSICFGAFARLGRTDDALSAADRLLDLVQPLRGLTGWSELWQTAEYRRVIELLKELANTAPKNSRAWSLMARAHLAIGEDDQAAVALRRSLSESRNDPLALAVRGSLGLKQGRFPNALADLDAAATSSPNSYFIASGQAMVLQRLGRHEQAAEVWTRLSGIASVPWQVRGARDGLKSSTAHERASGL